MTMQPTVTPQRVPLSDCTHAANQRHNVAVNADPAVSTSAAKVHSPYGWRVIEEYNYTDPSPLKPVGPASPPARTYASPATPSTRRDSVGSAHLPSPHAAVLPTSRRTPTAPALAKAPETKIVQMPPYVATVGHRTGVSSQYRVEGKAVVAVLSALRNKPRACVLVDGDQQKKRKADPAAPPSDDDETAPVQPAVDIGVVTEMVPLSQYLGDVPTALVHGLATAEDVVRWEGALLEREAEALPIVQAEAARLLPRSKMTVHRVVFQFDERKMTIVFSVPNEGTRVFFVPLFDPLFAKFKCRIWMHKVSPADAPLPE